MVGPERALVNYPELTRQKKVTRDVVREALAGEVDINEQVLEQIGISPDDAKTILEIAKNANAQGRLGLRNLLKAIRRANKSGDSEQLLACRQEAEILSADIAGDIDFAEDEEETSDLYEEMGAAHIVLDTLASVVRTETPAEPAVEDEPEETPEPPQVLAEEKTRRSKELKELAKLSHNDIIAALKSGDEAQVTRGQQAFRIQAERLTAQLAALISAVNAADAETVALPPNIFGKLQEVSNTIQRLAERYQQQGLHEQHSMLQAILKMSNGESKERSHRDDGDLLKGIAIWIEEFPRTIARRKDGVDVFERPTPASIAALEGLDSFIEVAQFTHETYMQSMRQISARNTNPHTAEQMLIQSILPQLLRLKPAIDELRHHRDIARFAYDNPSFSELYQRISQGDQIKADAATQELDVVFATLAALRQQHQSANSTVSAARNEDVRGFFQSELIQPAQSLLVDVRRIVVDRWKVDAAARYAQYVDAARADSLVGRANANTDGLNEAALNALLNDLRSKEQELRDAVGREAGDSDLAQELLAQFDFWQAVEDKINEVLKKLKRIEEITNSREAVDNKLNIVREQIRRFQTQKTVVAITKEEDRFGKLVESLHDKISEAKEEYGAQHAERIAQVEQDLVKEEFWILFRVYHETMEDHEYANKGVGYLLEWKRQVVEPRLLGRMNERLSSLRALGAAVPAQELSRYEQYYEDLKSDFGRRISIMLTWAGVWEVMVGAKDNLRTFPSSLNPDFFTLDGELAASVIREGLARANEAGLAVGVTVDDLPESERQFFMKETNRVLRERIVNVRSIDSAANNFEQRRFQETEVGYVMRLLDEAYKGKKDANGKLKVDLGFNTGNYHLVWNSVPDRIVRYAREVDKVDISKHTAMRAMQLHLMMTAHHSALAPSSALQADYMYYSFNWAEYAIKYQERGMALFDPRMAAIIGWFAYQQAGRDGYVLEGEAVNIIEITYGKNEELAKALDTFGKLMYATASKQDVMGSIEAALRRKSDGHGGTLETYIDFAEPPFIGLTNVGVGPNDHNLFFIEPPLRVAKRRYSFDEVEAVVNGLERKIGQRFQQQDADRVANILSYKVNGKVSDARSVLPSAAAGRGAAEIYSFEMFVRDVEALEARVGSQYTQSDFNRDEKMMFGRVDKIRRFLRPSSQLKEGVEGRIMTYFDEKNVDGELMYEMMPFDHMQRRDKAVKENGTYVNKSEKYEHFSWMRSYNDYSQNVRWLLDKVLKTHPENIISLLKDENWVGELMKMLGYCQDYLPVEGGIAQFEAQEGRGHYGLEMLKDLTGMIVLWKILLEVDNPHNSEFKRQYPAFLTSIASRIGQHRAEAILTIVESGVRLQLEIKAGFAAFLNDVKAAVRFQG